MLYKKQYDESNNWINKIYIMNLYHVAQQCTNNTWRVRDTAIHFNVSIGLASENLFLAKSYEQLKKYKSRSMALAFLRLDKSDR